MRRLQVPHLGEVGEQIPLPGPVRHHAQNVLRLPHGAEVLAFDGAGAEALGRLELDGEQAAVRIVGPPQLRAPAQPLHLLLASLKGPAMDLALRMATEAGATHIHPFLAERSVARGEKIERWQRIVASAAQQCGRADLPQISPLRRLDATLLELPPLDLRVGHPGAPPLPPAQGEAGLVVGPEGGLTGPELDRLVSHGARLTGLSRWVLRADTAVAVGLGLTAPITPFETDRAATDGPQRLDG